MNELAQKRARFISLYEAMIGYWSAKGDGKTLEQAEWWRVIDQIPTDKLDELFEQIEFMRRADDGKKKPLVPMFRRAWATIEDRSKKQYTQYSKCSLCHNEGTFNMPVWVGKKDGQIVWDFDEKNHVLSSYLFPCHCTAGDQWRKNLKCPSLLANEALELQRAIMGLCGTNEVTDRLMMLDEYLFISAKDDKTKSVQGFKSDLVRASLLAEEAREEKRQKRFI